MAVDLESLIEATTDEPPAYAVVSPFSPNYRLWQNLYGADHLALVCGCVHHLTFSEGLQKQVAVADATRLADDQIERIAALMAESAGVPAFEIEASLRSDGRIIVDLAGAVVAPTVEIGRALARAPRAEGSN